MLDIIFPTHGEILTRRSGEETPDGLRLAVTGIARPGERVEVNGVPAQRRGDGFHAQVVLKEQFNTILATSSGSCGLTTREIKVVWDKDSFRRVNFCIDDAVFTFAEIAAARPKSLFDHFFLNHLRKLHERYGLRLTINIFYRDIRNDFTLSEFPDCYQEEWRANSDWLRLAFHARAEFPDRLYQNKPAEILMHDYDQVLQEIRRFAGEETLIAPPNIHWSMLSLKVIPLLRERGVHFLGGNFIWPPYRPGNEDGAFYDLGYSQDEASSLFLNQRQLRYDFRQRMCYGLEAVICNLEPVPELRRKLAALIADPENEALHLLSHEQFSFPDYKNYLPDHAERLEVMARLLAEAGYRFVFFNEGFLGNRSWETPTPATR